MSNIRVSKLFTILPPRSDVMRQDLLATTVAIQAPAEPTVTFEQDEASLFGSYSDSSIEDEMGEMYDGVTFKQEEEEAMEEESPSDHEAGHLMQQQFAQFEAMTRRAVLEKAPHATEGRVNAVVGKLWEKYLAQQQ